MVNIKQNIGNISIKNTNLISNIFGEVILHSNSANNNK